MTAFDVGYAEQPFRGLCEDVPGRSVYPRADFRLEWDPVSFTAGVWTEPRASS